MDDQQALGNNGDHQQGHNGILHDDVEGKIFVGGLSWQTTEESMRFHFEKFGELSDIAIMIDKRTGQPRYVRHHYVILNIPFEGMSNNPAFYRNKHYLQSQRIRLHHYEGSSRSVIHYPG